MVPLKSEMILSNFVCYLFVKSCVYNLETEGQFAMKWLQHKALPLLSNSCIAVVLYVYTKISAMKCIKRHLYWHA